MKNQLIVIVCFACLFFGWPAAQSQVPPSNPHFPVSPFPAIHGGGYRQASTVLPGPNTDQLTVQYVECPEKSATAWLFYSGKYPNGERVIWGKSNTHLFKINPNSSFSLIDSYQTSKRKFGLNLNFVLFNNHEIWLREKDEIWVFSETDPTDPLSKITLARKMKVDTDEHQVAHLGVLHDGNIAFNTKKNVVGVMDRNGKILDLLRFEMKRSDIPFHNEIAVDEKNNFYMVTNNGFFAFHWNGTKISLNWKTDYDFGGNRLQGSGTTPTLIGIDNMDKFVVVCDSNTPANMVAFWRETPPRDWSGIQGLDRQIAGITALPNAKPPRAINAAIENSPVAWGYGVAAAQYNGFFGQSCQTLKGVYKCEWNPSTHKWGIKWARNDLNINGVLTYSVASNLVYGSGRENDCCYYYYGLNWDTGQTVWKLKLGTAKKFDDPGCANVVGEDGSLIFATQTGIIRLLPK
jgi:hypothetical protein